MSEVGQKWKYPNFCAMSASARKADVGWLDLAAHTRFVFSPRMRLPLPGLFRAPGCDAAGLCNQDRHTEPL
jgi:hypothetical protein